MALWVLPVPMGKIMGKSNRLAMETHMNEDKS